MVPDISVPGSEKYLLYRKCPSVFSKCSWKSKILENTDKKRFSSLWNRRRRFSSLWNRRRKVQHGKKSVLEPVHSESYMQPLQAMLSRQCDGWYTREWLDKVPWLNKMKSILLYSRWFIKFQSCLYLLESCYSYICCLIFIRYTRLYGSPLILNFQFVQLY